LEPLRPGPLFAGDSHRDLAGQLQGDVATASVYAPNVWSPPSRRALLWMLASAGYAQSRVIGDRARLCRAQKRGLELAVHVPARLGASCGAVRNSVPKSKPLLAIGSS